LWSGFEIGLLEEEQSMTWQRAIILKGAPPAVSHLAAVRPRLAFNRFTVVAAQLLEVSAPLGYGKTALLSQWHDEMVAAGKAAIWLSLDAQDTSSSFIQGLVYASMRAGLAFLDEAFAAWMRNANDPYEALTGWLVEVERSGQSILLLLDDADLAPRSLQEQEIAYVLANAPINLRAVISTRPGNEIAQQPAFSSAPIVRITAQELRLTEEETTGIIHRALGSADTVELANYLYSLTDGWPLGVQLAVAAHLGQGLARTPEESVSLALSQFFTDRIIKEQPQPVIDLLAALAFLDPIHPDLCHAVGESGAPVAHVQRLADRTPILIGTGDGEWLRLHPVARQVLTNMQMTWPKARRQQTARAASSWYADRGFFEEAAIQARLAGESDAALDMAEKAMQEMTEQGRTSDVLRWVDDMAAEDIRSRPAFWSPAAWAAINSGKSEEVAPLVRLIMGKADLTPQERFEARLLEAAAAAYGDDAAALELFASDWPEPEKGAPANAVLIHRLCHATLHYLKGRPEQIRKLLSLTAANIGKADNSAIVRAYADYYQALSYLWEGKPALAYEYLQPVMTRMTVDFDQRHRMVSVIAAVYAEAAVEMNLIDEARNVIQRRLPSIEKIELPDAVISGYLAATRIAEIEGRQDLAEVQIYGLISLGQQRRVPRIEAAGLSHLARFHARHGRIAAARATADELERLVDGFSARLPACLMDILRLQLSLAQAASLAAAGDPDDVGRAVDAALAAQRLALSLRRGRDQLLAQALHAHALALQGNGRSQVQLKDAVATAGAWGLKRLEADLSASYLSRMGPEMPEAAVRPVRPQGQNGHPGILTAREYDVLCGLAAHLSNKEIALSLGLSDETVKWHLKNVFQKLEATERKVAVARARMLGMI
jgi:LuxR family maltose regulon positive regulatory protein